MIKDQNIVIISGDFGRHPSSLEHLIKRFVPENRVLWVEAAGMRRPSFSRYDAKRALQKIRSLTKRAIQNREGHEKEDGTLSNIDVIAPPTIPFPESPVVRFYNERTLARSIQSRAKELSFDTFGIISSLPFAANVIRRLQPAWSLYYCPDEWRLWPGMNKRLIENWENDLLAIVDSVVVTSDALFRTKRPASSRARLHLVRHGVDVDHFARARSTEAPRGKKKATFFGLFDERIDQELLAQLVQSIPDMTLEVVGPVQCAIDGILKGQSVVWRGPVAYERLPDVLRDSDVLLLPYVMSELTRAINPLKARECLATGKPLVATALPELSSLKPVFSSATAAEFVGTVADLLQGRIVYDPKEALDSLASHSWEARSVELSHAIAELIPQ